MENFPMEGQVARKEKAPGDYWTRIFGKALEILASEGKNPDFINESKNLLSDGKFKQKVDRRWEDQSAWDDSDEEQEKNWAKGLAIRIKEEIKQKQLEK